MATKEEYLVKLKTQLDSWQGEVDELQTKASDVTDDIKAEIEEQIANLGVKFSEGEAKFDELKDATEDKWEELKDDAEAMFDNLIGDIKEGSEELIEDIKENTEEAVEGAQGICAKIKAFFS